MRVTEEGFGLISHGVKVSHWSSRSTGSLCSEAKSTKSVTRALALLLDQVIHKKMQTKLHLRQSWHKNKSQKQHFRKRNHCQTCFFLRLLLLGYYIFAKSKHFIWCYFPLKADRTTERIPCANYIILSQICLQQVPYLLKLFQGLCVCRMAINWENPHSFLPPPPPFFTSL